MAVRKLIKLIPALLLAVPSLAGAAEPQAINTANTAWVMMSSILVLFMTLPGLALFYGGLVRTKNVLSILMQCFAITCMASIVWVLIGYSLAFGDGGTHNDWLGGLSNALLTGIGVNTLKGDIPESVFAMFQMTFAIIAPALVVGGFAERMKFSAMMIFSLLWLLLAYIPVCHWVWGNGWLQQMGVMDFAGGTVIHVNAGVAALVAALVLGKRKGFPTTAMPPHNLTMTVIGACMLWVGWFGFNAGSALAANGTAGMTMLATHLGAAAGALTWMFCEWVWFGKPSVLGIVTGMVAGLGTITPASGFVGPLGAISIGVLAGLACFFATNYMKRTLHIDDSLDVFPVHGVGGILGTALTAVFAATTLGGVGFAEGVTMGKQIMVQFTGILVTAAWSGIVSYGLLKMIDAMMGLRVTVEQETEGLDTVLHNETGYNL